MTLILRMLVAMGNSFVATEIDEAAWFEMFWIGPRALKHRAKDLYLL